MSYTKEWRVATVDDNSRIGCRSEFGNAEYNGVVGGRGCGENGFTIVGFISKADVTLMAAAPRLAEMLRLMLTESKFADKLYGEEFGESIFNDEVWRKAEALLKEVE
jgi:hypothetical protein